MSFEKLGGPEDHQVPSGPHFFIAANTSNRLETKGLHLQKRLVKQHSKNISYESSSFTTPIRVTKATVSQHRKAYTTQQHT